MPLPRKILDLQARLSGRAVTDDPPPQAKPATDYGWVPIQRRRSTAVRVLVAAALGVVFLTGAIDLAGTVGSRFASTPAAAPHPPPGVDHDAARQLAVAFTTDYLSYDGAAAGDTEAAIARWAAGTVDTWSGDGQLHVDVATGGAVADLDPDRVVVQTAARIGTGTTTSWVALDVAVARTGRHLAVAAATFTGDAPTALTPPRTVAQPDPAATRDTGALGRDVFTALASGELDYITAPGVDLTGLAGAVTLEDVASWRVLADTGDSSTRTATAVVTWRLADTGLLLTQPYVLRITRVDGRWLVDAVGTLMED